MGTPHEVGNSARPRPATPEEGMAARIAEPVKLSGEGEQWRGRYHQRSDVSRRPVVFGLLGEMLGLTRGSHLAEAHPHRDQGGLCLVPCRMDPLRHGSARVNQVPESPQGWAQKRCARPQDTSIPGGFQ